MPLCRAALLGGVLLLAACTTDLPIEPHSVAPRTELPPRPAAERCAPRALVVEQLAGEYGERRAGAGIAADGTVLELWIRPDGRSWTLLRTRPDGMACLVEAGSRFVLAQPGRAV